VAGLRTLGTLFNFKFNGLTFVQSTIAFAFDGAEMNENIFSPSTVIKPYPFLASNHFTEPLAI